MNSCASQTRTVLYADIRMIHNPDWQEKKLNERLIWSTNSLYGEPNEKIDIPTLHYGPWYSYLQPLHFGPYLMQCMKIFE